MRIACVFVPQLALQAVLRRTPDARGGPVAVLEAGGGDAAGPGGSAGGKARVKRVARVTECSPEARREGVRAGMTGAQATAVCAGLQARAVRGRGGHEPEQQESEEARCASLAFSCRS